MVINILKYFKCNSFVLSVTLEHFPVFLLFACVRNYDAKLFVVCFIIIKTFYVSTDIYDIKNARSRIFKYQFLEIPFLVLKHANCAEYCKLQRVLYCAIPFVDCVESFEAGRLAGCCYI